MEKVAAMFTSCDSKFRKSPLHGMDIGYVGARRGTWCAGGVADPLPFLYMTVIMHARAPYN